MFRPNRGTDRALPTPPQLQPRFVSFIRLFDAPNAPLKSVASGPCQCQILRPFLLTHFDYAILKGVARRVPRPSLPWHGCNAPVVLG